MLQSKIQIATFISLLFHVSGLIAIAVFKSQLFISLTPLNLGISFVLLGWTQEKINGGFILFFIMAFFIGFASEWIGVNTGRLFGHYHYGDVLGPKFQGVPLIIGLNWFITVYCIGVGFSMLQNSLRTRNPAVADSLAGKWLLRLSQVIDGAVLAVFF